MKLPYRLLFVVILGASDSVQLRSQERVSAPIQITYRHETWSGQEHSVEEDQLLQFPDGSHSLRRPEHDPVMGRATGQSLYYVWNRTAGTFDSLSGTLRLGVRMVTPTKDYEYLGKYHADCGLVKGSTPWHSRKILGYRVKVVRSESSEKISFLAPSLMCVSLRTLRFRKGVLWSREEAVKVSRPLGTQADLLKLPDGFELVSPTELDRRSMEKLGRPVYGKGLVERQQQRWEEGQRLRLP